MKIRFHYRTFDTFGRLKTICEINSYSEIKKIDKAAIDPNTFSFIKSFAFNKDLDDTILQIRKELSIPEKGYDIDDFDKFTKNQNIYLALTKKAQEIDQQYVHEITSKFNMPYLLHSSIKDIIALGVINLPLSKLVIDRPYKALEESNPYAVQIRINAKSSKREVIEFVHNNWPEIQQAMAVQKNYEYYISDRDFKIIELKEKVGLKFKQIADILESENDSRKIVDESAVKSAYSKARKKITSLKVT